MAHRALLCSAIIGLLAVSPGARAKGPEPLARTIATLVQQAGLGDGLGIHVVRLHDAEELYRNRPERPRNPASNQKLLTSAAALRRLGPTYRAATKVEGSIENGRVAQLVVRAAGDPSLGYAGIAALAEAVHLRGVDTVDRIVIDDSYFDDQILPPAFEQQPKESAAFRAAISAFAVNRNSYVVHLGPGPEVDAPGRVRVLADDYVQIDNRTVTTAGGPPTPRIDDKLTDDGHLAVRVDGTIPTQARTLYYRRRVPDPKTYAARLLVRAMKKAGIGGALAVEYGTVAEQQPLIADMPSPPLSSMLYSVGKWSDNFTAEMLLKIMGAQAEQPGTSANGTVVVREELMKMGVDTEGLVMINGSGLFDGNQIAPRHLTQTLVAVYHDPAIRAEYVAHLAVAGSDGTLKARLKDLPRPRMVRAKTGTLRDVVALSGYVLGEPGRSVAFSFLANGIAGKQGDAKKLADNIVRALADYATRPTPEH
ncbi:MAG: D-alanyl-D-alanine carboxypeptidase/D-alanyl-D-alanine-endopeptidase [Deltaproteobacteria bacterium]|nr:D-alanyl-D-alanine carboxypeptidase/D-alanyl-D-alanine-endopeptidase [Deltaproteobacteria bacterium]